jgi:hypothetical protein
MFDKPAEASYNKIQEWSYKYSSIEAAKTKTKAKFMIPTETLGSDLKTVLVRRGTPGTATSYVLGYDKFRIEAMSGGTLTSAIQAREDVQAAIGQFSNQFKEVQVHGKPGLSAPASDPTVSGIQYRIPASVAWWENGVTYLVVAKDMSVEDLLKICESTKQN